MARSGRKNNHGSTPAKIARDRGYRGATRTNDPPAMAAANGNTPVMPKAEYSYNPRRPPDLRFDPSGRMDDLAELLAVATQRRLTEAEACRLSGGLHAHDPWLDKGPRTTNAAIASTTREANVFCTNLPGPRPAT